MRPCKPGNGAGTTRSGLRQQRGRPEPTPTLTRSATAAPSDVPVAPLSLPGALPVLVPAAIPLANKMSSGAQGVAPAATSAAPAPTAAPSRSAAITPVEQAAGSPGAGAPGAGTVGTGAPAQGARGAPLGGYTNMFNPGRQRSLAEMADEQINGGRRRDRLADAVSGAERPDCIGPNSGGGLIGLVAIPLAAATGKCK